MGSIQGGHMSAIARVPNPADRWFPDSYYSMQADKALAEIAESTALPPAMRLYFLCASRANVWGHASFGPGEMNRLLGCKADARRRALNSLKSARIAAQESTPLCVVLSAGAWRRGGNVMVACCEPNHADRQNLMWAAGYGWEGTPGEWHKVVRAPHAMQIIASRSQTVTRTETTTETIAVQPAADGIDPWADYYQNG
jgi:hypothetical protein